MYGAIMPRYGINMERTHRRYDRDADFAYESEVSDMIRHAKLPYFEAYGINFG